MSKPIGNFMDYAFDTLLVGNQVFCENKQDDPNMKGLHAHQGFEFHFSFSRNGLMLVGDQQFEVSPGKVFIIRPLVYHSVQSLRESAYKRTILSIEEGYFTELLQGNPEMQAIVDAWFPEADIVSLEMTIDARDLMRIQEHLQTIEHELKCRRKGYQLYVQTLLIQTMLLLGRSTESSAKLESSSEEMRGISLQLMAYISEHCCETLQMSALARHFHISKSYMFKIFKLFTGYTPHQYVMQERIHRAMLLLNEERESVTGVAARTGFNDSSHFIRTFKEATGMTPGEFKEASMSRN